MKIVVPANLIECIPKKSVVCDSHGIDERKELDRKPINDRFMKQKDMPYFHGGLFCVHLDAILMRFQCGSPLLKHLVRMKYSMSLYSGF